MSTGASPFHYHAFGGTLGSELEFPDLSPAPAVRVPDRSVRISDAPVSDPGEQQGAVRYEPGWELKLFRTRAGLRLEYGASGSYEICAEGREITWHRGADRRPELVRAVLLGPVMALALHESGILCLHGSAVAIGEVGAAFLAPKGHGKSTLAFALTAGGARLMSDDLVAVRSGERPEILPGVHSVRLLGDVARRAIDLFPSAVVRKGRKQTVTGLPRERLAWTSARLAAVYLLDLSFEPGGEPDASRESVSPANAAISVAHQRKLVDDLIGYRGAGKELVWVTEAVSRVPVFRLRVPRRLGDLPRVAERILSWHGE